MSRGETTVLERRAGVREDDRLPRRLTLWSAIAVLVGSTIGSGIFRVPSVAAGSVESIGAIALLWILGAVIALFGALTIAELAALYPSSGGIYVYLREAYGPLPAFLFGWTRMLVIHPASIGAISMIFAAYVGAFAPIGEGQERWIAAAIIFLLTVMNCRSTGWGAAVQNASTVAKVVALVGLAVAVFLFGDGASGAFGGSSTLSFAPLSWGGFGIALIAVMWTYDGWADLTYMSGEVKDPARTLPRALIGGVLIIVAVYFAVNAAYLYVLPVDAMAASSLVAADAATRVFGAVGASVVAALVLVSTFGAVNGTIMTGPRIFYALADDDLFFPQVASVHPRFQTPWVAIGLGGALGIGYVSFRSFEQLAESFILGIWPFYALAVGAVYVLRIRHPELERPYRAFGYPVVPLVFLLASLAMLGNALVRQPGPTLFGFGIILSGVPVYYIWRALKRRRAAAPRETTPA